MSTFRQLLESKDRIPERHVVIKKNFFKTDWQSIPAEDVALGLRRVADGDISTAKAEAAKYAVEMADNREDQIELYEDALMRWVIIFGTCDANDFNMASPLFEGSEENVRNALTSQAIRYVFDAVDAFHVETGPFTRTLSDDEIVELAKRLMNGPLPTSMGRSSLLRVRKLLGFVQSEIETAEETNEKLAEVFSSLRETNQDSVSTQLDTNG